MPLKSTPNVQRLRRHSHGQVGCRASAFHLLLRYELSNVVTFAVTISLLRSNRLLQALLNPPLHEDVIVSDYHK